MSPDPSQALRAPFQYADGRLLAGAVALEPIIRRTGTPVYIYSADGILERLRAYQHAFRWLPHLICYSVKANSNLSILRLLAGAGAGADIVSGGELARALRAGFPPGKIIFSGVGKTEAEIARSLRAGIRMMNVESEEELLAIRRVARRLGRRAPVSIRVNPDVSADTHHHIRTGSRSSKFGIDAPQALRLYRRASRWPEIFLIGVQCHIGSQITHMEPYARSLRILLRLRKTLRAAGIPLDIVDIGGGLGAAYQGPPGPHPEALAKAVAPILRGEDPILFLEPGRSLVAESGVLATRVLYLKRSHGKRFIVVDAAMNDLARPALYDAFHEIGPVSRRPGRARVTADVVGPVCESGDTLARARRLPLPRPGEHLAVFTTGAYGFSMSSQYNSRPRPPEVLIQGGRWRLIRRREEFPDLVRRETPFLKNGFR